MDKGRVEVVVKTTLYVYHGHTYENGATILMDKHDVAPAVSRGQIRIKKAAAAKPAKKPAPKKKAVKKTVPKTTKKKQKKGPDSNRATGPSEDRAE